MKFSFDFDATLQRKDVQEFARQLISDGHEVWVVTTRFDANHTKKYLLHFPEAPWAESVQEEKDANYDLWEVVDSLGIPRYKVRFTCMQDKHTYLDGTDFLWHLDDNPREKERALAHNCNVPVILVTEKDWKAQCGQAIDLATLTWSATKL